MKRAQSSSCRQGVRIAAALLLVVVLSATVRAGASGSPGAPEVVTSAPSPGEHLVAATTTHHLGDTVVQAQWFDRTVTRAVSGGNEPVRLLVQLAGAPTALFAVERFGRSQGLGSDESASVEEQRRRLAAGRASFVAAAAREGIELQVLAEYDTLLSGIAIRASRDDFRQIRSLPGVLSVEEDLERQILLDESVPRIRADRVWDLKDPGGQFVTGKGMRIAILDSGIDYEHPDLGGCFGPGCRVAAGRDFVNGDANPMDDNGHGTHVAGIAAANGVVKGVAPQATLLAYKVCDAGGGCWTSHVIAGLETASDPDGKPATDDAADVANLSLGSAYGRPDDILSQTVNNAVAAGMVVAVAAGNDYAHHTIGSPGGAQDAITVAASDREDHITDFSSRGPIMGRYDIVKPDVTAPGYLILSTASSDGQLSDPSGYIRLSGTSMATPHVAGAAALLRQMHPNWSPAAVKSALMANAIDLEDTIFSQGAGRIDVLAAAQEGVVGTPSVGFGLPLLDGSTGATLTLSNRSAASLQIALDVSAVRFMDGALRVLEPAQPVGHASLGTASLSLPAGGSQTVRLNLAVPNNLADGYYAGVVSARWPGGETRIPFMYASLGQIAVHLIDEAGVEMTEYSFDLFVAIARYEPESDFAYSNWGPGISASPPFVFYGPPGRYIVQANDHFFAGNDCTAQPPQPVWKTPYYLMGMATAGLTQPASATLDLRQADRTAIAAEPTPATPVWISTLTFNYKVGDKRLGLNTSSLDGPCPTRYLEQFLTRYDLLIAQPDEGPGAMELRAQAYGFSPHWRDMLLRNPAEWHECLQPCAPAEEPSNFITVSDKADRRYIREWILPAGSPVPAVLPLSDHNSTRVNFKFDLPGTIRVPHLSNGTNNAVSMRAFDVFPSDGYYITGKTLGLRQDVYAFGRGYVFGGSERLNESPVFFREFYERDLSAARPVEYFPPGLLEVPYDALRPLPPSTSAAAFGSGPFYPAAIFDNRADSIRIAYPVLGASGGNGYVPLDNLDAQLMMRLYRDNQEIVSESLEAGLWFLPALVKQFDLGAPGDWRVVIEATNSQMVGHSMTIDARFSLPAGDMNPPRVMDLIMPQRFVKGVALPVALRVSDPESGIANVSAQVSRNGGNNWEPIPLASSGDTWSGSLTPGNETEIALRFVVTDEAGNELRFEEQAASIRQTPVSLTIIPSVEILPYGNTPVTLGLTGSLLLANQDPLSTRGLAAIEVYLNNELAGFIHERARQPNGTIRAGQIDFDWTFVPTDFVAAPGDYPLTFVFDLGTYQRVEKTITLRFRETPQAMDDTYFTRADTVLSIGEPGVLANDHLPGGGQNSAELIATPQHGSLTLSASGAFRYVPNPGYVGHDSFRYRILGEIPSAPATATITVDQYRLALPYIVR